MDENELKKMAKPYQDYDASYCLDPFHKIHWGTLRDWQSKKGGVLHHSIGKKGFQFGAFVAPINTTRKLSDFTRISNTRMREGEWQCYMFAFQEGHAKDVARTLKEYASKGLWLTRVNQENPKNKEVLERLGAQLVSIRVAGTGADIYGIYYVGKRKMEPIPDREKICFARFGKFDANDISKRLCKADLDFSPTERGTAYGGPDKTWTRVVIRKSGDDRRKAVEQIANHPACKAAPELVGIMKSILPLNYLDAIMLTKVSPQKGTILRHTDFALDKEFVRGINPGLTMRMHIVLQGNPECEFHIWGVDGTKHSLVMKTGEIWYTDVRKPHAVDNKGEVERVHLVCDYFGTPKIWRNFSKVLP